MFFYLYHKMDLLLLPELETLTNIDESWEGVEWLQELCDDTATTHPSATTPHPTPSQPPSSAAEETMGQLRCPVSACQKEFIRKTTLHRHWSQRHEKYIVLLRCPGCLYKTPVQTRLSAHLKKHRSRRLEASSIEQVVEENTNYMDPAGTPPPAK